MQQLLEAKDKELDEQLNMIRRQHQEDLVEQRQQMKA